MCTSEDVKVPENQYTGNKCLSVQFQLWCVNTVSQVNKAEGGVIDVWMICLRPILLKTHADAEILLSHTGHSVPRKKNVCYISCIYVRLNICSAS